MYSDAFCNGKALETAFLETKRFVVIYDISPLLPGNSLVVPRRHIPYITDLTNDEILELKVLLRRLIPRLLKIYHADSYNIAVNAGKHAAMISNHLHFHIVPRNAKDIYQGKTFFPYYDSLQLGRYKYIKNVDNEVAKLRRVFKYKPHKK
ncbi:MAG: HIT domain-containing protein [Candidatus Micrarchaeales archaeon]